MKKDDIFTAVGMMIFILSLFYGFYWLCGGMYKNKKIECVNRHQGVEAHYNIMTGCWYWDESRKSMQKEDKQKRTTAEILEKYGAKEINEKPDYSVYGF